jgi:hypothetical protein
MGKNVKKKKIDYGGMADEVISTVETDTPTPTVTDTREQPPTPTSTPRYAPAHFPTVNPEERKTARLQLLVKPSTKSRLAKYARDHGTSSNEVVQRLLDELLDESGY